MRILCSSNRVALVMFLVAVSIFSFGCQRIGISSGGQSDPITVDFRSGTEALKMEFIDGMPPGTLYLGDNFNLGLRLENLGAADIERGHLEVYGYEQVDFFFVEGSVKDFNLLGKNVYAAKGEEQSILFPITNLCMPGAGVQKKHTTKFTINACYGYNTKASAEICVNPRPGEEKKGECKLKNVSLRSQGGPVGVKEVWPRMISFGDQIEGVFDIKIRKLASKGDVYLEDAVDGNCEDASKKNKIKVSAALSGTELECTPSIVELKKSEDSLVKCKTIIDKTQGAYTTLITVDLEYGYSQEASKEMTVTVPSGTEVSCKSQPGGALKSCSGKEDDTPCGANMVCARGSCISQCSAYFQGWRCSDIASDCPGGDASCIATQGCKTGYCPGSKTNVCCPR